MWHYSGFQIKNTPPKGSLPPSPVRDLKVLALTPNTYQFSWTATGDDLDDGVVSEYELLLLDSWTGRAKDFEHARPINLSRVVERDFETKVLLEAGSKVVVNVSLEVDREKYLTIRAVDAEGNRGIVSNVVTLSFAGESTSVAPTDESTMTMDPSSTVETGTDSGSTSDPRINRDHTKTVNGTRVSGHHNAMSVSGTNSNSSWNKERDSTKVVVIILLVTVCLVTILIFCSVHYCRRKANWRPKL
ncbi:calcium-activated chloride channel regulator 2-like [Penaeus monodon]|uniref:calcium-activated chloride channel regulator 2-like n=1 Tax=Penaeus monodon TaxID=6687 RepID=UPI0018A79266|nr:calcium-activated chloride channel regulator 2-like [Penaeus monodon]